STRQYATSARRDCVDKRRLAFLENGVSDMGLDLKDRYTCRAMAAESDTRPVNPSHWSQWSVGVGSNRSHSLFATAPAPTVSAMAASSSVPLHARSTSVYPPVGIARRIHAETVDTLSKHPTSTAFAPAHARNARVPLVVVMTSDLPNTDCSENSMGELPKSN